MAEWSTDTIQARERFAYWREAVCRSIFNISVEAPPGPFSARMAARSAGPLRIAVGESTSYTLVRDKREVASAPADQYSIYLQLRGQTVISQCDETETFGPNDIAVSDLHQPFRAHIPDGGLRITAVIPAQLLDVRAPWIRRGVALRRLAADMPFVDLAKRHMVELANNPAMTESATSLLTQNLCNLLALASAPDVPLGRLQGELQTEAMLAVCRHHLQDPDLSPQFVADRLGISVRTLHLRFKEIGTTFGRWVLEQRLEACRKVLRERGQRDLKISEIAYRFGFNDLSYFNKSFRARFDQTPRDWRAGAS